MRAPTACSWGYASWALPDWQTKRRDSLSVGHKCRPWSLRLTRATASKMKNLRGRNAYVLVKTTTYQSLGDDGPVGDSTT